ncbi:MAG: TatD family hydrolase [Gammaproteobacteria bacterium]|nr:TatD family hydrolase [Gammaproteobacteria bacterium]
MLIDTHCHLDFPEFDLSRQNIIKKCHQFNIDYFIVPSITRTRWENLFKLSDQYAEIIPAIGLHPYFISEHQKSDLDHLEKQCQLYQGQLHQGQLHQGILIGETGLDFYRKDLHKDKQIFYFDAQLSIARQYHSPIIIHARKSHDKVISMIKSSAVEGGIIHAFNGSYEQAKEYMKYNFKFGFGGAMTYLAANKIRKLAKQLPLDSIVLETDAPDMRPSFISKDEINSPVNIHLYINELSLLRPEDTDVIEEQIAHNTRTLIGF